MDAIKIGKFINRLRKEKGLTQKELGNILGISDNSVSKWERGINCPDLSCLNDLSEILGVSVNELLNGEKNKRKKKINEGKEIVLESNNLSKKFGNVWAIKDINIKLFKGEIVGLIGANGAGKTTLLKTLLDLFHKTNGEVIWKNKIDFSEVSYISDNISLYPRLSGLNNIKIQCLINDIKDEEYVAKMIKELKIEKFINKKVKKYSLGMQKRLMLVMAFIKRPKVILLDEPFNGLDPLGIKDLRELLVRYAEVEEASILISSHILSELEDLCDRFIIIDNGRIVNEVAKGDLLKENISLENEFMRKVQVDK